MNGLVRWMVLGAAACLGMSCGSDSSNGPGSPPDETPPPRPTHVRIAAIGDGEVWLSWSPVVDLGAVRYVVYRAVGDSAAIQVDTTVAAAYKDSGLVYEAEYTYFVTAMDAAGNQSFASERVGGQPYNTLAPLAPTGLRAFAHNLEMLQQRDIVLDWDGNAESDLARYRVYRSLLPTFTPDSTTLRAEVTTPRFVDQEVEVGTTYYFRVTAVDRGGKESQSSEEAADVPLALPQLEAPVRGELASAMPTFRWRAVAGARCYQVVVTTSPTSGEISDILPTPQTQVVFAGRVDRDGKSIVLVSGRIYHWKVIASTREDALENSVSGVESFKVR